MKSPISLQLLLLAAVATPLIAFWPKDTQHPEQADWAKHVRKACESRRFGIRLAAAKKVGAGGDAAVPAIMAYVAKNGPNAVPSSLVDAIADSAPRGQEEVVRLLTSWSNDVNFYWRSSAMRGRALRAGPPIDPAKRDQSEVSDRARAIRDFKVFQQDPAWLMRTHARLGSILADVDGKGAAEALAAQEPDPRARVRLVTLLLKQGKTPPLQPLFDALADQRTFLETPWGPRLGQEAKKALKRWLGDDFPELAGGDTEKSIAILRDAVQKKSGQTITLPKTLTDRAKDIVGGIEILSCKFGDQFVQWSADGTLYFGIDGAHTAKLPAAVWQELCKQRTAIALESSVGAVICDSLRVRLFDANTHVKVAPQSLPAPAVEWLKRLAQSLERSGETEIAADLLRGLGQFEAR